MTLHDPGARWVTQNPKHEIRNKSESQNSNPRNASCKVRLDCREMSQFTSPFEEFGFWAFEIVSDFEIRISDFILP
jgi:hypothetical protein